MKSTRKTIIYLFLIFHALHFLGALYIDARQDDLGFLLSIKGYLPWIKYYALAGLVLFLFAYLVVLRDTRSLRKSVEEAKEEHTMLKAKLFDYQEASKKKDVAISSPSEEKSLKPPGDQDKKNEEEDDKDKEKEASPEE